MRPIILSMFLLCLGLQPVSAESVRLKSGVTIEGVIVELTENYVVIDREGRGAVTVEFGMLTPESVALLEGLPKVAAVEEAPLVEEEPVPLKMGEAAPETAPAVASSSDKVIIQGPPFDGRKWIQGFHAADARQSITEYVPEGQTVENWREMVTVNELFGLQNQITPEGMVQALMQGAIQNCAGVEHNIIGSQDGEVVFEWQMRGCPTAHSGEADEYDIGRVVFARDRIYIMQYMSKTPIPLEKREEWIRILSATQFGGTEAHDAFMEEVDASGTNAEVQTLVGRAKSLLDAGRCDAAIPLLDQALSLNARYDEAYVYRGSCHLANKDLVQAAADYEKAIETRPDPLFYNVLGKTYVMLEEMEKGAAALRRYLEAYDTDASAWYFLALATNRIEFLDKAEALGFEDIENLRARLDPAFK